MFIGYARVSTPDQSLNLQRDALLTAGCDPNHLYTDIASGAKADRPGLEAAVHYLRAGDTLVVWKLDRLGRSLTHLIDTVRRLDAHGIGFKSLQEHIDTTTPGGKLVFHVFAALAEFERDLIGERTKAGLTAARARGRTGGRKRALSPAQIALAKSMKADPGNSIADICATLKISKRTLYRYTGSQDSGAGDQATQSPHRKPIVTPGLSC
jgi:DNA invertase Pin-like site-specific DNA recombinase